MKRAIATLLAIGAVVGSALGLTSGSMTVTASANGAAMDINVAAGGTTLADITAITFGTTKYTSITSATTSADSVVLTLAAGQTLTIYALPTGGVRFYGTSASATSVSITMKDQGDQFFGICEQNVSTTNDNPDLRGRTINITAVNIETGMNNAEPNAKVWSAFYMSSLGYGSFFDSFAEGTYVFGVGGVTTITHTTNTIDWYLFYGPTGDKIMPQYYGIIGAPKSVPIWGCGFTIWNNNFASSTTTAPAVMTYAANFNANKLPCTALWVDRPYSDGAQGWGEMDFSAAFSTPAPAVWAKQLSADTGYNIKLMTWVAPLTFGTPLPPAGLYFSGGYYYLDLSNPAAFNWYVHQLDSIQDSIGVQGHKMDRCEESMTPGPVGSTWHDGTPTAQQQGKYLYLNAKVTDSSLRIKWGSDQFNFARGAYHRCQPYLSAVWAGDTRAPWPGLVGAIGNVIKDGFMGFPLAGSDIGGYGTGATKIPTQQFMRWLEFGTFCGLMENMLDGKEPWLYTATADSAGLGGQTFMQRYASYGALRLNMLPYTYSMANQSASMGVIVRPLPYMYPTDANVDTIGDEYLFGPAMLVAPISSATNSRSIYLPAGTWYSFWNYAETHVTGRFTTATIPVYQIPVYIKANSIFPTGNIYAGNTGKWIGATYNSTRYVQINAFPDTAANQTNSFTYMDYLDSNKLKTLTVTTGATAAMVTVTAPAMTVPETLMVRQATAPTSVVLNGATLTASQYQYNATTMKLTVEVPANTAAALALNGAVVGVRQYYQPASLHGSLEIRSNAGRLSMIIPGTVGIGARDRLEVALFNLEGKCIWSVSLPASSRETSVSVPASRIGHGMYFGTIKANGLTLGRAKIALP
jgi:alpha-glucosidase (family GH31 glycosyl hydrolase)